MENISRRSFLRTSLKTAGLVGLGAGGGMLLNEMTTNARAVSDLVSPQEQESEIADGDYERAMEMVRDSVFRIEGRDGHGSGFLLAPGYLLTNFHVTQDDHRTLEMREQPRVIPLPLPLDPNLLMNIQAVNDPNFIATTFTHDDRRPGRSFRVAPVLLSGGGRANYKDMSLLRLPPDAGLPDTARPVVRGIPRTGAPAIVLGMPYNSPGHVTIGRVSREVTFMNNDNPHWHNVPFISIDSAMNPGNSGGPIFTICKVRNADGQPQLHVELIGMSTYNHRGAQGLGGGIRSDYIAYIAKTQWGLPLMTNQEVAQYRRDFPRGA
ncbi:trypsin-like peptidase domain-containing protein [Candidatus Peregrinibacteria bacterium]|nr:trypsin-like peptidase domain-containing protein [Candidatus Peregrinibacteria bacterium]MBI4129359.1 trypsin-like peptidase domain-containing protein [Candidatus Peregrinibacteria bacterium]